MIKCTLSAEGFGYYTTQFKNKTQNTYQLPFFFLKKRVFDSTFSEKVPQKN